MENPKGTIRSLCALTGLPYFDGKELFWKYNHEMLGTNSRGVRDQLERGTSVIKKPDIPPDFAPLAAQVQESVTHDRLLQHLLRHLKEHDAATLPTPDRIPSHRYHPTPIPRLAYEFYRFLKLRWIRFRWNVLEPRFGPLGTVSEPEESSG